MKPGISMLLTIYLNRRAIQRTCLLSPRVSERSSFAAKKPAINNEELSLYKRDNDHFHYTAACDAEGCIVHGMELVNPKYFTFQCAN